MLSVAFTTHDSYPVDECALVDGGLGESNEATAPLHEVQPISAFARLGSGQLVGGAVGRWWGLCCELQQLWVDPSQRRQGIGANLVRAFESRARTHGCTTIYVETFSFQAPELYLGLGYKIEYERKGYPRGIVKYHMSKLVHAQQTTA